MQVLVDANILPAFKQLVSNPQVSAEVLEQVIWCYGNIAGESLELRDTVLADGVVGPIAAALDNAPADSSMIRNLSWCLSNFMKGKRRAPFEQIAPGVPALVRALQRTEQADVINDIIWGLSFFTQEADEPSLRCLIDVGGVPKIIQLIDHINVQIAIPALRVVGNFLASDQHTINRVVIDADIIGVYGRMIDHPK